jgi:hypothetical protein
MIRIAAAALALLATASFIPAHAQLPPLQQQWLRNNSPPIQQAPLPPVAQPPVAPQPQAQTQPPQPAPLDRASIWQPAGTVRLQALDKVNAQTAALTIKVGGSATFGSLTITAKACVVRPKDLPADAAAFLAVTDSHPDSPGFDGWILEAEPAASMMQHPIYDLRVTGCT